jgi:hypothetical protein
MLDPKADLSVEPISETDLIGPHVVANFDIRQPAALELQQRLSAAQTDGSADAGRECIIIVAKSSRIIGRGPT